MPKKNTPPESEVKEVNLDEILSQAGKAMRKQNYREAVKSLQVITSMVPEHVEAWNNLGVAYLLLGENQSAETALRSGLEHDPENPHLVKNLIQSLLPQEEKVMEGMNMLVKFLEIRPQDPDALYMLGRCLDAAGDFEKSTLIYERVLELDPDYQLATQALEENQKRG